MVGERDLWISANVMLRQHGDAAELVCEARAANLVRHGDNAGAAVFRRLAQLVPELRRARPDDET